MATELEKVEKPMPEAAAVLVIEDDASVREVLDMVFAQAPGIYYTIAAGGANGIAKLEEGPPDVILTDLLMPRVSGAEVIQFARKKYPGIPIIAISGHWLWRLKQSWLQEQMRKAKAFDHLQANESEAKT